MKVILLFFVKLYRVALSPLFPPVCRFYPTCSAYTHEALLIHGSLKGTYLSIKRILCCHPFYKGSVVDPVPPKKK